MAESLAVDKSADRKTQYEQLNTSIKGLIADEPFQTANLANAAAALKEVFGFFWVGFYLYNGYELLLGPFQGPVACTRINMGRGVCGTAASLKETQLVPNVEEFPGHIACSAESKSEIVIPLLLNGELYGVLDVDSDRLDAFDEVDKEGLERIAETLMISFGSIPKQ